MTTDMCCGFFDEMRAAGMLEFPPHARVLELGCAEADWIGPVKATRPDVQIWGLDWRPIERPDAEHVWEADILTWDGDGQLYDAIVAVSTIEHIGLGAYGDPNDVDGDTHAMQKLASFLKPGGWLYADVPYRPEGPYEVHPAYRAYDPEQLRERLIVPSGLTLSQLQVFKPNHPDAPYIALVLTKAP